MQKKLPPANLTSVNVDINDILTPKTCGHIIIEIIKYFAYQKLQIPHAYDVLRYLVQKKRDFDIANPNQNENMQSKNHFRVASSAVDVLDGIFQNITTEMESEDPPDEVLLLWGAIPMNAKEVCRIQIPASLNTHFYKNHKDDSQKLVMKTLRHISFSQDLLKTVHNPLAPTNMFVILKRNHTIPDSNCKNIQNEFFLPTNGYQISSKIPQTEILLNYNCNVSENCCKQMQIFCETEGQTNLISYEHSKITDPTLFNNIGNGDIIEKQRWSLSNASLKGFKEACVGGRSVSDIWLKSWQGKVMTNTIIQPAD